MADQKKSKAAYIGTSMTLTERQWAWLDAMASKHKLSSPSKAMRCCINCVALGDVAVEEPTEKNDDEKGSTKDVELSKEQLSWLEARRLKDGMGAERAMVQSCMAAEEYTVFGIIRCKLSIAQCEGAQEAVENIGEEYGRKAEEVVVKENIDISSTTSGCDDSNQ